MLRFIAENILLLGVAFASFVAGVFLSSQWLKDKLGGIPAELRTALNESEALAKRAVVNFAKTKAVAAAAPPVMPTKPADAPTVQP